MTVPQGNLALGARKSFSEVVGQELKNKKEVRGRLEKPTQEVE